MTATNIEWADAVWNPVRGCTRVSEGCRNCYAEAVAARFSKPGLPYHGFATSLPARWTGNVALITDRLKDPLHWRKPRRVFVNSMSDIFHEELLFTEDIAPVFQVMRQARQHQFLVLTKRPGRMLEFCRAWGEPLLNVWLGVSVEDQKTADERIPVLLTTPAAVRFVSYEPALGPVDFKPAEIGQWPDMSRWMPNKAEWDDWKYWMHRDYGIRWIIVGGESGPHARPFDVAWARSTIAQCRAAGVACFVKQLGPDPYNGHPNYYLPMTDRKGGDMSEWPADLRVREFPR